MVLRRSVEPAGRFCAARRAPRHAGQRNDRTGRLPLEQPGAIEAWAVAIEGWSEALALLRAHLDFSIDLRPLRYREAAQWAA
jgi:hypothetical protein